MIRPKRDLAIALILLAISFPAFLNGLPGILRNEASVAVGVAVLAALVGFFSAFMSLNFWSALRMARRLERGEGMVAKWTVRPEAVAAFRRAETARGPNHFRLRGDDAINVLFGGEAVLADGQLYVMPTAGLQTVHAVRLQHGDPPFLEFGTSLLTAKGSPSSRTLGRTNGTLRVPASDREAALTVVWHYEAMLAGRTIVDPNRWTSRIRVGVVGMILSALAGIAGYSLAVANDWRADEPLWWVPLVLLIAAPILGLGSLVVALTAAHWRRQQRGQR
jgi:hypothetical protein